MKKAYENIIFDMGGVLVNWDPQAYCRKVFKQSDNCAEKIDHWKDMFNSNVACDLERGLISRQEAVERLPQKYDKKEFLFLLENVHKDLYPLEKGLNIFKMVKRRGYKTYVLSNFQEETFNEAKYQYDFLKEFDGIVLSYQTKSMKPEPRIYKTLIDNYSLNPKLSIFIDDMKVNINGAKRFGIDGILCKSHEYVLSTLKQFGVL
jgi:epoxide hydrolase-like predicted phosphatase